MDTADGHRPDFGAQLRDHRAAAGLTQDELAERANVSPRSIGDIERGVSRAPQRNTVRLLAEALGLRGVARDDFEAAARRRPGPIADAALPVSSALHGAVPHLTRPAAPPLVGREAELHRLERHLAGDGPPLLMLAGEPGLGKSRLLAEAAQQADQRGWCVLTGGCQRRGSQEPFAPLLSALKGFLARRSAAELRDDLRGCVWLVRLLPELAAAVAESLPRWTLPPEQERRLMFDAVAQLLVNAAARAAHPSNGVLLVLDDLQWAGIDALDLLGTLTRSGTSDAQPRLRVVAAYRDTEVQPHDALATALADWAHAGNVTHHTLPPLDPAACRDLLTHLLDEGGAADRPPHERAATQQQVLRRAGGVPFFVVSYAQALRRGDVGGGAAGVPWDVTQGVRQRVAALPEPARTLLAAAAVIGRISRAELLTAVLARPEDETLAALEAACQARLLVDEHGAYHFAHDVIREVVEGDISSARRGALHRRVAAAIEQSEPDRTAENAATLAFHYLHGEVWASALAYLAQAGARAATSGAYREALSTYAQALVVSDRLGSSALETAAAVAERRGFVNFDGGRFLDAVLDFERMRDAAMRRGDRRQEGLALAYAGLAAFYGHEFEAAEASLRAALALAGDDLDEVRLSASIQLASMLMVIDRRDEAMPFQRLAEELAERVDDPQSQALWAIAGCETLHWGGRYDDSLALLNRWQAAVTSSQQLVLYLWQRWEESLIYGGLGRYDAALAAAAEVMATCARIDESFIRARAMNTAGWLYAEIQDFERALALNQQSLDLAHTIETSNTEIGSNARLNLGDSLLALGRFAEAEEQFQAVEQIVRHPRPQDRWMLWRYAQHLSHSYGELWLRRGDLSQALACADECLRRAEASDSRKNIVKARRLRGQVFLLRGELKAAEAELHAAVEIARSLGNPPQLWKTLAAVGDLREAQGTPDAAREAYQAALATIDGVAASLQDATMRETFLASRHVTELQARAMRMGTN